MTAGEKMVSHLQNGGTLEKAQQMTAHEPPRTTDEMSLDEIEKVII